MIIEEHVENITNKNQHKQQYQSIITEAEGENKPHDGFVKKGETIHLDILDTHL